MAAVDWWWILHPFLAVVLVYPLIGVVVRLAIQTRARRLQKEKLPATVGRDHSDLGRWLAAAVVVLVLIALSVVIVTKAPLAQFEGVWLELCSYSLCCAGRLQVFLRFGVANCQD